MIIIIAKHAAWGAADNFYRAFKSQGYPSVLLCLKDDKYNRTGQEKIVTKLDKTNINFWLNKCKEKDNALFICSPTTIQSLIKKFGKEVICNYFSNIRKKIIFITGTEYLRNYKKWNIFLYKYNFHYKFAEAEMVSLSSSNIFLCHPMEYLIPEKENIITISHAPGLVERPEKKGTPIILSTIDKLKCKFDFNYEHIVGVDFKECLYRKGKSHIFIDQINPSVGGIGKNGYEGLALGCVTLSSVNSFKKLKEIDCIPPVINVNTEDDLFNELFKLLSDQKLLKEKLKESRVWDKNNYKNTVKKILEIIK